MQESTTFWFEGLHTDLLDAALGKREVGLCDIILCEVIQGFRNEREAAAARAALLAFPIFSAVGIDNALKSAENYRNLRRQGITVRKTIDCLIATFVIENGFTLLSSDRDYEPFATYLGLAAAL